MWCLEYVWVDKLVLGIGDRGRFCGCGAVYMYGEA